MTARELKIELETRISDWSSVQEIRIRAKRPVLVLMNGKEIVLTNAAADSALIREVLEIAAGHSLYAYEDEIRQGFLTMEGGHRIGLSGTAVASENGIRTIKDISALNIRLARQVIGCADPIIPYLYIGDNVQNTLLLSPPGAGKTTMLRDVIRQISNGTAYGTGKTVSVVDERSEIGACLRGIPQCDLGMRADVMDRCPKTVGMLMMLRSMAPQVMAVDEIGTREDACALREVSKCGCRILATVHGDRIQDIMQKSILKELTEEGMFSRYVVLTGRPRPGTVCGIYDEQLKRIDGKRRPCV